jgi:hypothetical protein
MRLPKLLVAVAGLAWLVAAGDATAQGPIRIGFLSPL